MNVLKLSTVVTIRIGPCLDSAGAEYTGLVIGDLTLTKNGVSAAMAAAATLTHIANGMYSLVTIAGNADTLGRLQIDCNKATYQIPPVVATVVPATVYAALVENATTAAGGLGDMQRVAGTAQTAADLAALTAALTLYAYRTVIRGTVGATAPSTTSFTPSALDVAGIALNQLVGRVIIFDKDTTTTALRGQATVISGSSVATLPLLTVTALTTAPVSGDLFSIV